MPRTGIIGSYGNSVFDFLWSFQTVFWSTCTVFHSYQQWVESSNFSTSSLYLVSFWLQLSLVGMKGYLIVVWVCISFMAMMLNMHGLSTCQHWYKTFQFFPLFLKKANIYSTFKQKEWFTHFFHPPLLAPCNHQSVFCICKLFCCCC